MDTTKPGWKTTEFWLTLVTAVCGVVASFEIDGWVGRVAATGLAVLAVLGYTYVRGAVKRAAGVLLVVVLLGLPACCAISPEGRATADALARDFPALADSVEPKAGLTDEQKASVRELLERMRQNFQRLAAEVRDA